jgi:hypothetical protein
MIDIPDRERQMIAWAFFVGGAIFLFRSLALELMEAIGACLLKSIKLNQKLRKAREADRLLKAGQTSTPERRQA